MSKGLGESEISSRDISRIERGWGVRGATCFEKENVRKGGYD
jgi:hypothetical protein